MNYHPEGSRRYSRREESRTRNSSRTRTRTTLNRDTTARLTGVHWQAAEKELLPPLLTMNGKYEYGHKGVATVHVLRDFVRAAHEHDRMNGGIYVMFENHDLMNEFLETFDGQELYGRTLSNTQSTTGCHAPGPARDMNLVRGHPRHYEDVWAMPTDP